MDSCIVVDLNRADWGIQIVIAGQKYIYAVCIHGDLLMWKLFEEGSGTMKPLCRRWEVINSGKDEGPPILFVPDFGGALIFSMKSSLQLDIRRLKIRRE